MIKSPSQYENFRLRMKFSGVSIDQSGQHNPGQTSVTSRIDKTHILLLPSLNEISSDIFNDFTDCDFPPGVKDG